MGCVRVCVGLRVSFNLKQALNDDEQMPAVGVSTYSSPLRLQHSTSVHTSQAHTWFHCGGMLEREGKRISAIPHLFNKLIKHCVLHPEAILK